ncbi:hypothetical protein DV532_29630 (plasmid) [Pseudomonas sp. Leaf58]|uniref:hypothetical protein n=1 Tax=Pseudomonas sp. Leaf58 TaxID=1736226 RepID=UPI0006FC4AA7|nr:hypothetical protein [Pseudomonas sp. Leaf58]AYG48400.1 hypothetical protein DV532_29630 [Pseudomonas sp. Leaf58]KQN62054.1 hypothetical protein ASF02_07685 [Pseudomonas sp. Leaf58]
MRVLFASEMGSAAENFHLMKIVAAELRARMPQCEIILATSLKAKDVDISWADKGYSTPKFTFRHDAEGDGVIQQLHYLGWTTDELRKIQFNNWRTLLEELEPEQVICCNAPGAVIVATMLGCPCLTLATEPNVDESRSLELFPELNAWAHDMVGMGVVELTNRPGIAFLSSMSDTPRSSMMLNASPFEYVAKSTAIGPPLLIGRLNDDWKAIQQHLQACGLTPERIGTSELFSDDTLARLACAKPSFVLGAYDFASTSLALSLGVPYLGMPQTELERRQAAQLEASKRSYRITSDPVMVDILLGSMPGFQRDAAARHEADQGGFCSIETALDMVI